MMLGSVSAQSLDSNKLPQISVGALPAGFGARGVAGKPSLFVAIGSGPNYVTSADGISWSINKIPLPISDAYFIHYTGARFLMIGKSTSTGDWYCGSSIDGLLWAISPAINLTLNSVTYTPTSIASDGTYCMMTATNTAGLAPISVYTTGNSTGSTWSASPSTYQGVGTIYLPCIAGNTSRFMALGNKTALGGTTDWQNYTTTQNGTMAVGAEMGSNTNSTTYNKIISSGTYFIAAGTEVLNISNTTTWGADRVSPIVVPNDIAANGSRIIIVQNGSTAYTASSATGLWYEFGLPSASNWIGITSQNVDYTASQNIFVAVSSNDDVSVRLNFN
jgi:hypothetical protein